MPRADVQTFSRRRFGLLATAGLAAVAGPASAQPLAIVIHRSPTCGCCTGWVKHVTAAGFQAKVIDADDLAPLKKRLGVREEVMSCHTAIAGGYFIEGHVPAADIKRLLRERPKALGLAVPGMPVGSPGMESPDGRKEPYETLLVTATGTRVFARHG